MSTIPVCIANKNQNRKAGGAEFGTTYRSANRPGLQRVAQNLRPAVFQGGFAFPSAAGRAGPRSHGGGAGDGDLETFRFAWGAGLT